MKNREEMLCIDCQVFDMEMIQISVMRWHFGGSFCQYLMVYDMWYKAFFKLAKCSLKWFSIKCVPLVPINISPFAQVEKNRIGPLYYDRKVLPVSNLKDAHLETHWIPHMQRSHQQNILWDSVRLHAAWDNRITGFFRLKLDF